MIAVLEGVKGALEVQPAPVVGGVSVAVRGARGAVLLNSDQLARLLAALAAAMPAPEAPEIAA